MFFVFYGKNNKRSLPSLRFGNEQRVSWSDTNVELLEIEMESNQNRLEKICVELFEIANSYAANGCGYIALALRGLSQTLQGILESLK